MKLLQLKNRMFEVVKNDDGTLTLIGEDMQPTMNAGSIIGSLGGIDATLLRCVETEEKETFAEIIGRKQAQAQVVRDTNDNVKAHGQRCDVGDKMFATLDGFYYRYEGRYWVPCTKESYANAVARQADIAEVIEAQEREYRQLVAAGTIEVTIDNLAIVMRHLLRQNWGTWDLPKMRIGYSANQYNCDGVTAVTITLDRPIDYDGEKVSKFQAGAPRGYLSKYQIIRL